MGKAESDSRSSGCGSADESRVVKDPFAALDLPPDEKCVHCGKYGLQVREGVRKPGGGSSLLAIEGGPAIFCPSCGESWFTAQTMHEFEQIRRQRNSTTASSNERDITLADAAKRIEADDRLVSIRAVSDDAG